MYLFLNPEQNFELKKENPESIQQTVSIRKYGERDEHQMKVFISWSGTKSNHVAAALRDWLPDLIQSITPWMSEVDIGAGARWSREIESELSSTNFGIVCVTQDNVTAPWILFESGALAKTVEGSYLVPYLIDMSPADIPSGPLSQFMAKRADRSGTLDLVCTINRALEEQGLPSDRLERTFERCWPVLERTLKSLPPEEEEPARSVENIIPEILDLVRGISRQLSDSISSASPTILTAWDAHSLYSTDDEANLNFATYMARRKALHEMRSKKASPDKVTIVSPSTGLDETE